jgi:hypothetical protein
LGLLSLYKSSRNHPTQRIDSEPVSGFRNGILDDICGTGCVGERVVKPISLAWTVLRRYLGKYLRASAPAFPLRDVEVASADYLLNVLPP